MANSLIEGVAAKVLAGYLGKYVKGIEKKNLKMSIGSGNVSLEKLELRADALSELDLPIFVKAGLKNFKFFLNMETNK